MGNHQGDDCEYYLFHAAFTEFLEIPGRDVELSAFGGIAFDPALDTPIDVFEEDSLGACPTAPETTEECGDEEERESDAGNKEEGEPKILSGKGQSEEVEASIEDVEEYRGITVDRNPRQ